MMSVAKSGVFTTPKYTLFNCYTQLAAYFGHFGHGYLEAHCESHAASIWPPLHQHLQGLPIDEPI